MLYPLSSFLHITGAVLLSAAMGIEWICILNLRKADSLEVVRRSLSNYSLLTPIGPIATLLILVPGIYMAVIAWRTYLGWIEVSFAGLVVIALVGSLVTGKKLGIVRALLKRENSLTPDLKKLLTAESLMVSLQVRTLIFLGIILLMVVKPAMITSLIVMAASIAIGSLPVWRGTNREAAVLTEQDVR